MANDVVYYVEPNEEVKFNNEDLCIGVKLEVDIPSRMLVSAFKGGSSETYAHGRNPKPDIANLLGGEDGYLTTSYSDAFSLDLTNGGNKQSIGIENIQIKYNSWFYPEVTAKFIDLRGNAIMNPMETNTDGRGEPSFLNALFLRFSLLCCLFYLAAAQTASKLVCRLNHN